MKVKFVIFPFLLFFLNCSCTRPINDIIEVYHFRIMTTRFEEISDTIYLNKKLEIFNNRTYEIYSELGIDSSFKFAIDPLTNIENKIIYFDDTCELISAQEFNIAKRKIKIFKYYYDRENSMDEESYIYYNPDIGLIGIYNLGWFSFDYFKYKSVSGLLEKFKSDTTGFIKENI